MTDENGFPMPPADEPLDDAARARMREQIRSGLEASEPRRQGRWAVPLAAAAAVAVVAATSGYVVSHSSGPDGDAPGTPSFADSSTEAITPSTSPAAPSGSATPTEDQTDDPSVPDAVEVGSGDCEEELRYVLKGADPVLSFDEGSEVGTFYVKGSTWTLCEVNPSTTTIQGKGDLDTAFEGPVGKDDVVAFRVSTNIVDFTQRHMTQIFVAGGPMPAGVLGISYAFPDGVTLAAETKTDDQGREWWRMEYVAQEGVLADPQQNQLDLDPIMVTVSTRTDAYTIPLEWGVDTCAQLNHGC